MKSTFLILFVFYFQCISPFHHIAKPKEANINTPSKYLIAILPIEDERIEIEEIQEKSGWYLLIPLLPYVAESKKTKRNEIETGNYRIKKDSMYALIDEFNTYPNIKEAYITEKNQLSGADFVVNAKIRFLQEKKNKTLYGLSLIGIIPIILGAPFIYNSMSVDMELSLKNIQNNSIVYSKRYRVRKFGFHSFHWQKEPSINEIFIDFVSESIKRIQ